MRREVLHERDEERQILRQHALLVERKDETTALGAQQEIRVLDAFGDALAGDDLADVVITNEGGELLVADVGIDRHDAPRRVLRVRYGVAWSARSVPARLSCHASVCSGLCAPAPSPRVAPAFAGASRRSG